MIRKMLQSDLVHCGIIYAEAFQQKHWGIDWTKENAMEYIKEYFEQNHFVGFVIEAEGDIIGFLCGCTKISGSSRELYMNEMAVSPQFQSKGYGKKLLDTVKEYVKENSLAGIVLYTSEYSPAKSFYEKNGFHNADGTICMYFTDEK